MKLTCLKKLILGVAVVVIAVPSASAGKKQGMVREPSAAGSVDFDNDTYVDAGNTLTFVTNYGLLARDFSNVFVYDAGCFYPYTGVDHIIDGSQHATVVFSAGIWVGGKVNGDLRVTVADYASEYTPGPISGGTFIPGAATSPAYRVYKLFADSGQANPNLDYLAWPVADGAPVDGLGRPLITGTQSLYAVYNDMDTARHNVLGGESLPLGIEVQQYVYADSSAGEKNAVYFRYTLHNRLTNTIDSCFVGLFVDPDLGFSQDDRFGSDSALQYVYCYNGDADDNDYGNTPPAVGFQLLKGPIVPSPGNTADFHGAAIPDHANLPAWAATFYVTGADPSSLDSSYNMMKGLWLDGSPMVRTITQDTTRFVFDGDPWDHTGWLQTFSTDGAVMISTGPFTFAPGDSQCVLIRMVVGQGGSYLESVQALRTAMSQAPNVPTAVSDPPSETLPDQLSLAQNYPNPFNPATTIDFALTRRSHVTLEIVNVLGQRVRVLVDDTRPAGTYQAVWDGCTEGGGPAASGIYFYRLLTDHEVLTRKMVLVK